MSEEPKEPIRKRIQKYLATNETNKKVKTHLEKHKMKYAIGATFVATTVANVVYFKNRQTPTEGSVQFDSDNNGGHHNTINNINHLNIFFKRVSKYGNPLGRPGIAIVDTDTEQMYDTIERCAYDLGVTPYQLRKLLDGKLSDINGRKMMRASEYYKDEIQKRLEQLEAMRRERDTGY